MIDKSTWESFNYTGFSKSQQMEPEQLSDVGNCILAISKQYFHRDVDGPNDQGVDRPLRN